MINANKKAPPHKIDKVITERKQTAKHTLDTILINRISEPVSLKS